MFKNQPSHKEEEKKESFVETFIGAFIVVCFFEVFFPDIIPLDFFYWGNQNKAWDVILSAKPVFLFGICFTALALLITKNSKLENMRAEKQFISHSVLVLFASAFEEVSFRWILFLSAMVGLRFSDWLFGGFYFGTGIVNWFYTNLFIPFSDFITFHQLTDYLYHPASWVVGAAMISTNGKFRDGHLYQGPIGAIDAWFFGMFMYKIVFICGIWPAILVHIGYNMVINVLAYIDKKVERLFY
ncbi:MAG: hypothetical protein ACRCXZ_05075 [Patescibacteria group bacterium]